MERWWWQEANREVAVPARHAVTGSPSTMLPDAPRTLQASVQSKNETRMRQLTIVLSGRAGSSAAFLPIRSLAIPCRLRNITFLATRDIFEVLVPVRSKETSARAENSGKNMRRLGAGLAHRSDRVAIRTIRGSLCPPCRSAYMPTAQPTSAERTHAASTNRKRGDTCLMFSADEPPD
ncbi:hypothetical protein FA95DRAFT_1568825 [Auriscalpium vulgare]|uniref:Uncharacterized protein n=1 Tax=Auriscalpium vulgare TaxID=40419 RepID=A0ACB8SB88_9AGAM|nr:hypothetical protein FA95DRAFT_1568825 [Auriscalpium vulgare]